jgi:hypothetical protein
MNSVQAEGYTSAGHPVSIYCGIFAQSKNWRVTVMARARSNYKSKLQTQPLVREGVPYQETRRRRWEPDTKTD